MLLVDLYRLAHAPGYSVDRLTLLVDKLCTLQTRILMCEISFGIEMFCHYEHRVHPALPPRAMAIIH